MKAARSLRLFGGPYSIAIEPPGRLAMTLRRISKDEIDVGEFLSVGVQYCIGLAAILDLPGMTTESFPFWKIVAPRLIKCLLCRRVAGRHLSLLKGTGIVQIRMR
jgi:hypothetical protein